MPTVTPSTMIIRACQMIGELAIGDTLISAQEVAYLSVLNGMLESWALDDLTAYQYAQDSFAVSSNVVSYTIGPAATVSTARPIEVKTAFVRDTSNLDTPLRVLGQDAYNNIVLKSVGITYPQYIYYDATFSVSQQSTIYIYPAPSAGLTVFMWSTKVLQSFPTVTTVMNLPPGYQRAFESNLAVEIAPGFVNVSPDVRAIAKESKGALRSANIQFPTMKLDAAIVANVRLGQSILTGP